MLEGPGQAHDAFVEFRLDMLLCTTHMFGWMVLQCCSSRSCSPPAAPGGVCGHPPSSCSVLVLFKAQTSITSGVPAEV
eukprot:698151-Amphidinium_carterae.1